MLMYLMRTNGLQVGIASRTKRAAKRKQSAKDTIVHKMYVLICISKGTIVHESSVSIYISRDTIVHESSVLICISTDY